MEITPRIGVDEVRLGMMNSEVEGLLGAPVCKSKMDWPGGHATYSWEYPGLGLSLSFCSTDAGRLSAIVVTNRAARLEKVRVIGRRIAKLQKRFPTIRNREGSEDFGFFDDSFRELSYYVERSKVVSCTIRRTWEDLLPVEEAALAKAV